MRMIHAIDGTELPNPRAYSTWNAREVATSAGRLTFDERLVIGPDFGGDESPVFERRRARIGDRIVSVDELDRILALVAPHPAAG